MEAEMTTLCKRLTAALEKTKRERDDATKALQAVSFFARINHGTKSQDYGELVDPLLKRLGLPTGVL